MPKEVFGRGYRFMDRKELLSFEEIERLARAFVAHGVEKIRITGGEPLLRRDLEVLVGRLIGARRPRRGADDERRALAAEGRGARRGAGSERVTVSLDSLDDATFRAMNDVGVPRQPRARRDRRSRRGRPEGEGERRRQARCQRRPGRSRSPATSAAAATSCASSSTWTSERRTAGGSTTSSRPPRSSR